MRPPKRRGGRYEVKTTRRSAAYGMIDIGIWAELFWEQLTPGLSMGRQEIHESGHGIESQSGVGGGRHGRIGARG